MKKIIRYSLILALILIVQVLFSQNKCVVLKSSISGQYKGKCKNGLAHGRGTAAGIDTYEGLFIKGLPQGEGTYTWADGSSYSGEWAEGMRHGVGTYRTNIEGEKFVQEGLWQKDMYKGKSPDKPIVTYKSGVDRYNFKKSNSFEQRVMVDIFKSGSRNQGISNFSMISSSGQDIKVSQSVGYTNVVFPVTVKIFYTTASKLNSSFFNVNFEFIISEPGDWTVELHN